MLIYTESSIYEFNTADKMCRRFPSTEAAELRKDADWVKYLAVRFDIGQPMKIVLENLAEAPNSVTLRTTTPVKAVQD